MALLASVAALLLPGVALARLPLPDVVALCRARRAQETHEERRQAALVAMQTEEMIYWLGLPHMAPEGREAWAQAVPDAARFFRRFTGQEQPEEKKPVRQSAVRAWDIAKVGANGNR